MNDTRIRKIARVGKARDFKSQIPYFKKVKPDLGARRIQAQTR